MNKVYVKKELIVDESFSELDFDLQNEFGFDYDEHEEFVELSVGIGYADGYPIKIDRMIELLENMKTQGVTHIELDYHCDHIGYQVSGYSITEASKEEIENYENEKQSHHDKEKKRMDLLRQLKELDEQPKKADGYPF
jgi:hypothetical protein